MSPIVRRLKMKLLKHAVASGLFVGGVVLFLNILIYFVGPIIFPGESGMILLFPLMILNFPLFGYHYYGDLGYWLFLICFFLSPVFYFSSVYLTLRICSKGWKSKKQRYGMSLASAAIILILLGSVFGKEITLRFAIRQLGKDDIGSYEKFRQSSIVLRYSSEKHIPDIIKRLTILSENDSYSIDAKRYLIQTLQNLRAKQAVPVLLELIKTSNNEVAEKAIEAVGAIGGPDEAVPLIVKYMEKNNYSFILFPQPWTFKKYRSDPELTRALLQACNKIENNDFEKGQVLEALTYVADYETLLKIQEEYKSELNKSEYWGARRAIEQKLRKKRLLPDNQ